MDYTIFAEQEQLNFIKESYKYQLSNYVHEAEFLKACYETGIVGVLEKNDGSGFFYNLWEKIKAFFKKMADSFKATSAERFAKLLDDNACARLKEAIPKLKENATKVAAQNITPYWNGPKNPGPEVARAFSTMANDWKSMGSKDINYKYADVFFGNDAGKYLDPAKRDSNYKESLKNIVKNYFRYGEPGEINAKVVTVSGSDIAAHVEEMVNYLISYTSVYTPLPGKMGDSILQSIRVIKEVRTQRDKAAANAQSENKPQADVASVQLYSDTYLSLMECTIKDTMLSLMVNYCDVVMEADNNTNNKPNTDDKEAPVKPVTTPQEANPKAGDNKSDDNKSGNINNDNGKDAKSAMKELESIIEILATVSITAYQTAIEERFMAYKELLELCGAAEYWKKQDTNKAQTTPAPADNKKNKNKK